MDLVGAKALGDTINHNRAAAFLGMLTHLPLSSMILLNKVSR